jgi:hypothetical protein
VRGVRLIARRSRCPTWRFLGMGFIVSVVMVLPFAGGCRRRRRWGCAWRSVGHLRGVRRGWCAGVSRWARAARALDHGALRPKAHGGCVVGDGDDLRQVSRRSGRSASAVRRSRLISLVVGPCPVASIRSTMAVVCWPARTRCRLRLGRSACEASACASGGARDAPRLRAWHAGR